MDHLSSFDKSKIKLSFPGGAGGHWLRRVILNDQINDSLKNFHNGSTDRIFLSHDFEPQKFDYFYSGSYFFNFWCNSVYKHWHLERQIFYPGNFQECFKRLSRIACHIKIFDTIKELIDLNFDLLISDPDIFLQSIHHAQSELNLNKTSSQQFIQSRQTFFNSCMNVSSAFENFNNLTWVSYVVGQSVDSVMDLDDLVTNEFLNPEICKQYALDNYHKVKFNKVYMFDQGVPMPDLIGLTMS